MESEFDKKMYSAWRRSEAHQVPMTQEGIEAADLRYESFKVGYRYGMKAAAFEMEKMHKENKHIHKFYLFAHNKLKELLC